MAGPYYENSLGDGETMGADTLEAIETGFANVDADKAERAATPTAGNVASVDGDGNLVDAGVAAEALFVSTVSKSTNRLTVLDDLDTELEPGIYAWVAADAPAHAPIPTGVMIVENDGAYPTQLVFGGEEGNSGGYYRRQDAGSWYTWQKFMLQEDMDAHAALTNTHGVTGTILGTEDILDSPASGATDKAISANYIFNLVNQIATDIATHADETGSVHGVSGTILGSEDVVASAINASVAPISSGFLYDLINALTPFTAIDLDGEVREKVYNCTGLVIDPANGTMQYKVLNGMVTMTASMGDGESVYIRFENADSYPVAWGTAITWTNGGSAPTLTANCGVVIWRQNNVYYGAMIGSFS